MNKKKAELEQKLAKVVEREKQLKAQLRALDSREREAVRKKETRAKIILGGFIAAQIKHGKQEFLTLFNLAIDEVNERDKAALLEYKRRTLGRIND